MSLYYLWVDQFRLVALLLHCLLQEAVNCLVYLSGHEDVPAKVPMWGAGLSRRYQTALKVVQRPFFQQTPSEFNLLEVWFPSWVIHQALHYVGKNAMQNR